MIENHYRCISSSFNYLLVKQVYDNLFLLFSKRSCLQLLSSNLCNYYFLISRLLTVSFFYLLFFYPTCFHPIHHTGAHTVPTKSYTHKWEYETNSAVTILNFSAQMPNTTAAAATTITGATTFAFCLTIQLF